MQIRYTGTAGIREIDPYIWNAGNGYVQDVTGAALINNLLTYPDGTFQLTESDPLAVVVGAERAVELAVYHGVYTPDDYERYKRASEVGAGMAAVPRAKKKWSEVIPRDRDEIEEVKG